MKLTKIAVFYDGGYFSNVSSYYLYQHKQEARISISGMHEFIKHKIATELNIDERLCHVKSHYFRGRYSTKQILDHSEDGLKKDRLWEDVLINENVQTHYMPISNYGEEKGVDVAFALEVLEQAYLKQYDVLVLVAGDSDYVPLIRKVSNLGIPSLCLGFSFQFQADGQDKGTKASQQLMNEATFAVAMEKVIDGVDTAQSSDRLMIDNLFIRRHDSQSDDKQVDDGETWQDGIIVNLPEGKGYGFIKPSEPGKENLFFHRSSLQGGEFADLFRGMEVSYVEGMGQEGICAIKVKTHY